MGLDEYTLEKGKKKGDLYSLLEEVVSGRNNVHKREIIQSNFNYPPSVTERISPLSIYESRNADSNYGDYLPIIGNKNIKYNNNSISSIIDYGFNKDYKSDNFIYKPLIDIEREGYSSSAPFVNPETPLAVESKAEPLEHKDLLKLLEQDYPGIRYVGMTDLKDQSQHNVAILKFEYQINGQTRELLVAAKDRNRLDETIPKFLDNIGIKTYSVLSPQEQLMMQYVGVQDLRKLVKSADEKEVRSACKLAVERIAQVHSLATASVNDLQTNYGLTLAKTNYVNEFKYRFIRPVSNNSLLISSHQEQRLMQAYTHFASRFKPTEFIHGDYHAANCRMAADECYVIDWEWARMGEAVEDISRLVNGVLRDRPSLDAKGFSDEMLKAYSYSRQQGTKKVLNFTALSTQFQFARINDELYKIGEYLAFGEIHPKTKTEKLEKSKACVKNTLELMQDAINSAQTDNRFYDWKDLTELKLALVDFLSTTQLAETVKSQSDKIIIAV